MALTLSRIEALAPDQASLAAARKLLKPSSWPTLASDGQGLVWGEAQGSGSAPYRVIVCETDAGYKCTCPSRKFPCKHSLALMWLRVEGKASFAPGEAPQWVRDWTARRRGPSAEAAEQPPREASIAKAIEEESASAKADPEAEARAAAQREKNRQAREAGVLAGLDELDVWLKDQIERGLAVFVADAASSCRKMAQRLVDAKAPGLATRLDSLPARLFRLAEPLRPQAAAEELGLFHLLAEAYRRQASLDAPLRDDVRQLIGWTQTREALLADAGALRVADRWRVFLTRAIVQPDRLRRVETWLLRESDAQGPRFALLLDFVPLSGGGNVSAYSTGDGFEAELVYYASPAPMRALVARQIGPSAQSPAAPLPGQSLGQAFETYRSALAARPWLDVWPMAFRNAHVRRAASGAFLVDETDAGLALPLAPELDGAAPGLAMASRLDGVGLWDGRGFLLAEASSDLGRWTQA
ncbi:SWIM zinc finger family protein [Methylosinus sp. Sm6]|uniref:SWIM zinc finger family protein n=1 Tax=Methylosinus sp. Sm6 TaxID=2866948 RepID=UPI001C99F2CA|nr:SWIM zinc finger family protein [Methylosinus sp. Sm6]